MQVLRLFTGTLLALLVGLASLAGQTSSKRTPEQVKALSAAHQGDFDYLLIVEALSRLSTDVIVQLQDSARATLLRPAASAVRSPVNGSSSRP